MRTRNTLSSQNKVKSLKLPEVKLTITGLYVSMPNSNHPPKPELTAGQLHRRKPLSEALFKARAKPARNAIWHTIARTYELLGNAGSSQFKEL